MNAPLVKTSDTLRLVARAPAEGWLTMEAGLIGVQAAKLALRSNERQILLWIGSGDLQWAFDLRARGGTRSCIRVLAQSVVKLQQARTPPKRSRRDWRIWVSAAPTFDEVLYSIFRHSRAWLRTSELMLGWNCCAGHIRHLIELNYLKISDRPYKCNEARLVSRESVVAFMRERRITKSEGGRKQEKKSSQTYRTGHPQPRGHGVAGG
jgi:hypothetical protein